MLEHSHPSQDRAPYDLSRVIGSFNDVGMAANCLRGLDDATQEEFKNPTSYRTIREHVSNIIKLYFEQQSVITQARILHVLIKHKKLKRATKLLGFKYVKNKNACENVTENVTTALSAFGKSRKIDSVLHIGKLQLLLWHEAPQEIEWSQ